ncbi:sugar O-acetyltransferase [Seonamhaeicola algicola]|uniref:Acetyltransferase n=1 Tax=Seonamhaeicola algicola TaxID=1719036 RepID=A0A5C7ATL2_9FLAO|nr:sugar O-acetyltransferase [Seonamhaeicola algicola]TXE12076.1 sugar O-acetyltransferase [Seonamhaeicola algicola]
MLTEKQKMLAGKPYKAFDLELLTERQNTKEAIFNFNNLNPKQIQARNAIIKKLFGSVKDNFFIEPPFRCDYGYNIEIGNNFYSNYNLVILDCAKVSIGNNVFIAPNVGIYTAGHPIHHEPRNNEFEYAFPIHIGNNAWIGGNTVINPGVTIGNNVVIGSGSVVTKNIPDNVIAFGNPCKIYREITEKDKQFYFKKYSF